MQRNPKIGKKILTTHFELFCVAHFIKHKREEWSLINGSLVLCRSEVKDIVDRSPVGGQLRIFDGSFENNGSVALKIGAVNPHGSMIAVEGNSSIIPSLLSTASRSILLKPLSSAKAEYL